MSNISWPDTNLMELTDRNPFPVLRVGPDGVLLYANPASWMILSHWGTEPGGKLPKEWMERTAFALTAQERLEFEIQIGFKTMGLAMIASSDGQTVIMFGQDLTDGRRVEKRLLLDSVMFENLSEALMVVDIDRRILEVNNSFSVITGYAKEEILGENLVILQSDRHEDDYYKEMWQQVKQHGRWRGEIWSRRKNGEVYPTILSISAVAGDDGQVSRYFGLFSDISTVKQTEEQLYHMAHYDSLTGLSNRRYFHDRVARAIAFATRTRQLACLLYIDLDGFKLINDSLGHQNGDRFLVEIADRLRDCVRAVDTVARLGGDEFTVVIADLHDPQAASFVARKILKSITEPIVIDHRETFVSASIGISIFPHDADTVEDLIHCADTALYQAKRFGKNGFQFFSPEMNTRSKERFTLQSRIRKGLDDGEFFVLYQPQVDLSTGDVIGAEALLRWNSPELGIVGPDHIVPLAEETGLIYRIGEQVLRMVCAQGLRIAAARRDPFRIAINISALQLKRPDFVDVFETIIRESGLPARYLEFELTESILIEDISKTMSKLERFKSLGVTIAIDDFGTKYSSLSYLRMLPIDRLKIDRSFVHDIEHGSLEIASAIIAMGRSLNLELIAEGVETEHQARVLYERGCSNAQGFFFSEPLPFDDLLSFRAERLVRVMG